MTKLTSVDFKVPALLLALSLVPILGGIARLHSLHAGASVSTEDARFSAAPIPIVIHVLAASVYALLGAFQFSTPIRRRWPAWHRRGGLLLISCALLTGATGLWMTAVYTIPSSLQGPLLYGVRLLVGVATLTSVVEGWTSIVRRDFAAHEAWMIRAYALAQGAGTQAVILLPLTLIRGPVLGITRDVLLSVAWLINLAVAELAIGRKQSTAAQARTP